MKRIGKLLVLTVMAGAGAASAHDKPQHQVRQHRLLPQGCSGIQVTAPGLRRQPRSLLFSTRQILDLEFETRFDRAFYGEHVLHFRVFTPSGFLYQELEAPFVWPRPRYWRKHGRGDDGDGDGTVAASLSFPRGIPVQMLGDAAHHGHRRDAVEVRLPVAGTSITMSTLYGRWTVQAFLDDRARPCSPVRPFTIHGK
jgi:hypothetical protein